LCCCLCVAGPDRNALRLLLLAELVSAAGFERDRLYIEWQLHFDPEQWVLQHSEQEVVQPGLIQVWLSRLLKHESCRQHRVTAQLQHQRQQQWCW
jgi:hypothetical protein